MSEFLFTVEKVYCGSQIKFYDINSDEKKTIDVNSNQGLKMAHPWNSTRPTQFVKFCMGVFSFFFVFFSFFFVFFSFFLFFFFVFFSKLSWPGGIPWVGRFWDSCQMRNFTYSNWSLTHFFEKIKTPCCQFQLRHITHIFQLLKKKCSHAKIKTI